MPYCAYSDRQDKIVNHEQGDPLGNFSCICQWCDGDVAYVRQHKRGNDSGDEHFVDGHFRYYDCTHGTVDDLSDGSKGSDSSGGGGGEHPIHKRRKAAAMQEGLNRFDAADYDTERYIGEKRADAVIIFEELHDEYGKGLVIEYQHKNEGKDIPATEKHFANHGFTTIWLWEDQFSFTSNIPDIDFFGGRVFTPWRNAIYNVLEWTETYEPDMVKYEPDSMVKDVLDKQDSTEIPKPKLPNKILLPHPYEVWKCKDAFEWDERFSGTAEMPTTHCHTSTKARPSFIRWIAQNPDHSNKYYTSIKNSYERGFKRYNRTFDKIPEPNEWGSTHSINVDKDPVSIEIKMPPEYFYDKEEILKFHRDIGAGDADLDLCYHFDRPTQSCQICSDDADYYLYIEDQLNQFKCTIHNQFIDALE